MNEDKEALEAAEKFIPKERGLNSNGEADVLIEKLCARIKELEDGIRYIAKDMAALEIDCAHDQCDMYVMKAKELLGYTR